MSKMKKQNKIYICKECRFRYYDGALARKYEEWCKKHKSCNLEITKHAIQN